MAGRIGRRVYRTKQWKLTRLRVLRRDGYACVLCGRRAGLEVDHKNPIAKGGDWFDVQNLRTVCRNCHIALSSEEARARESDERRALRAMALS